ncbi:MAG: UDP-N-acetylmuramoyl-L-alanyl-D-glutamate--2,6-diaminopimelate ligase [Actinomycetota bacterium]|nr:UDP-N-acetylmuramoyl-L-alanyl-D-glutamate--2,6-diaminopimelate ligase [Actinomycetota bacterium]
MSTSTSRDSGGLRPTVVAGVPLPMVAQVAGARTAHSGSTGSASSGLGSEAVTVSGVTLRAQWTRPGDLFAALPGAKAHGADFVVDALDAGAIAVLTDAAGVEAMDADARGAVGRVPVLVVDDVRSVLGVVASTVYGCPSSRLPIIGVTGTSGKTTTGYLLEAALTAGGHRTGLIGTVETRIAGQATTSLLTTPEAPDLQAMFALMLEQDVDAVVMEVSSHALSLGRVAGTSFAVGAFTNLSQDHLDFHPDMESYFRAKALLFDGRAAAAVIDIDDEYGRRLAGRHPAAVTVSAAGNPGAGWSVTGTEAIGAGAQRFTVRRPSGSVLTVELAMPGRFNVANAIVALACIDAIGADVEVAARALRDVAVPGRMERVDAGQDFLVVVDYAHKPAAVSAVLEAISADLSGRLIVVIGAGGDRDAGKRPVMGSAAAALADLLVVTDDNPRSEAPAGIRAAILRGARADVRRLRPGSAEVLDQGDRREAIRTAIGAADSGDVVVIAGKGHEQGQEIGGVVHPFSDRAEVLAALQARQAADVPPRQIGPGGDRRAGEQEPR